MFRYFLNIPDNNRRITTGNSVLNEVDGLRFIAIMAVIVCHVDSIMQNAAYNSPDENLKIYLFGLFQGVQLFFAISGYILARSFFNGHHKLTVQSLKKYFVSRLLRLEPPYFLALIISFVALVFIVGKYSFSDLLPHLGIQAIYANWFFDPGTHPKVLPLAWTLEMEILFYILLPLIYFLYRKNLVVSRIAVFLFFFLVPFSGVSLNNHVNIIVHLPYFMAGVFVADLQHHEKNPQLNSFYRLLWQVCIIASLVSIPAVLFLPNVIGEHNRLDVLPYLFVIILYGVIVLKLFNGFFTNKWICFIGSICYSLYLFHFMIISIFSKLTLRIKFTDDYFLNFLLQALILVPACLVGGYFFYRIIERPALIWRKKYLNKTKLSQSSVH